MASEYDIYLDEKRSGRLTKVTSLNRRVPNPAVVVFERATPSHDAVLSFAVTSDASPRLVAFELRSTVPEGTVDADALRSVRLAELVRFGLRYLAMPPDELVGELYPRTHFTELSIDDVLRARSGDGDWSDIDYYPPLVFTEDGTRAEPEWLEKLSKRGPSDLRVQRVVAAMYRLGEQGGKHPNLFVQQILNLSRSTASHWIKLAREAGQLEPSTRKPTRKRADDA